MNAVVTSQTVRGSVFRASFCDHPLGSWQTLKVVRQGPGSITLMDIVWVRWEWPGGRRALERPSQ